MTAYILRPHDWKLKTSILFALAVMLLNALLVTAGMLGIDVILLRPLVAFIFLTFIPGMLMLRILRIHNINTIESLVYSAGLSLAFTMLCGIIVNFTLPLFNISRPLQTVPVTAALCIGNIALMIAAYIRDRAYIPPHVDRKPVINIAPLLFLLFLLSFLILGVTVSNISGNNIILLLCIVLICFIIAIAAFGKFILPSFFPPAIFVISLCLLFQTTLMSPYLVGTDIYTEYQVFQQVFQHGIWDYAIPDHVNSCLSITILGPIYALSLNAGSLWVFKAIYPIIFSLVPLALFRIFRIQFGPYRALFACFLFMAVPTFSLEMISLCRQQVAELFFVLFILLLVDHRIKRLPKLIMAVIFTISISVSHYSFGIISMIFMVALLAFYYILRAPLFIRLWTALTRRTGGLPGQLQGKSGDDLPFYVLLIPILIFIIFELIWYSCISSGVNLELLSVSWNTYTHQLGEQVGGALSSHSILSLFNFGQRDELLKAAVGLDFLSVSLQGKIFRVLQYITQIFIALGCLRLLIAPRGLNIKREYVALSVTSVLLLLACIFIPGFAERLNATRWYHIALITLAPFCVLGGETVWAAFKFILNKFKHVPDANNNPGDCLPGFRIFFSLFILIPYFLATSGFLYEITGQSVADKADTPYSIALSSYRIDFTGIFNIKDGAAAQWLFNNSDKKTTVSTDDHASKLLRLIGFNGQTKSLNKLDPGEIQYVYLTSWNLNSGELTYNLGPGLRRIVTIEHDPLLKGLLDDSAAIYVNGGAKVLLRK